MPIAFGAKSIATPSRPGFASSKGRKALPTPQPTFRFVRLTMNECEANKRAKANNETPPRFVFGEARHTLQRIPVNHTPEEPEFEVLQRRCPDNGDPSVLGKLCTILVLAHRSRKKVHFD